MKTNNQRNNESKQTVRNWLVEVVGLEIDNMERFKQEYKAMPIEKRLSFIEKVLPFILPTVKKSDEVTGAAYTKEELENKISDWE